MFLSRLFKRHCSPDQRTYFLKDLFAETIRRHNDFEELYDVYLPFLREDNTRKDYLIITTGISDIRYWNDQKNFSNLLVTNDRMIETAENVNELIIKNRALILSSIKRHLKMKVCLLKTKAI